MVVEPQEWDDYARAVGESRLLVLPFSDLGLGSIPARNWVWEHSRREGHARHWILDDNIIKVFRRYKGKRIPCASGPAFSIIEEFTDRYENLAISGMCYDMFAKEATRIPPIRINVHVYSNLLIMNGLPFRWRGRYNEDTDLCLQAMAGGWCTVLFNAFLVKKVATMRMKGGNTDHLYRGDGRLKMARSLERVWPGAVETKRRFKRPQHVVRDSWKRFDTPLRPRPDFDRSALPTTDEFGMRLTQVRPIRSPYLLDRVRRWIAEDGNDADARTD